MSRHPHWGQSLSEYALIGGLVLLLAIPVIIALGGTLENNFSGMLPARKTIAVTHPAPAPSDAARPASQSPLPPVTGVSAPGTNGTRTLTLENGKTITLNDYPADFKKIVETVGANGTTDILAQQIVSLAQALQDAGEMTPEQAGYLNELANQAHKIASVEKLLEDAAAQSNGDRNAFLSIPISLDGKTYANATEMNDSIGYITPGVPTTWNGGRINESQILLDIQKKVASSGAMSDPQVAAFVNQTVRLINDISDTVQSNVNGINLGDIRPDNFNKENMAGIVDYSKDYAGSASQFTNGKAAKICTTGNGKDSGNNCSG